MSAIDYKGGSVNVCRYHEEICVRFSLNALHGFAMGFRNEEDATAHGCYRIDAWKEDALRRDYEEFLQSQTRQPAREAIRL